MLHPEKISLSTDMLLISIKRKDSFFFLVTSMTELKEWMHLGRVGLGGSS